ncbi:pickpocket protein 28 [Anastrepha ludens]|uniref:pickpocket protein 28 n=1 Tax=Anastrepha ludens TaxID=28586 RepID=UPI0023B121D6|nr:pickpocket protein 28 [Anastrepha ludens]
MDKSKASKILFKNYCRANVKKFLRETTLHGLKYLADDNITIWEKSFFLCAFLAAIIVTANLIANVYAKWISTPVIIGISPHPTSILSTPFPAVTICNMNQVCASRVAHYKADSKEGALLKLLCNEEAFSDEKLMDEPNFKNNNLSIPAFLQQHAQPCSRMVLSCTIGSVVLNCSDIFHEVMTDEGLCCVFNILHPKFLYTSITKKIIEDYERIRNIEAIDWNPEDGYPKQLPPNFYPSTAAGTGVSMGLSLMLDAEIDDYYCSTTNGPGFKIGMHSPIETTTIRETALILPIGYETRLRVDVVRTEATSTVRKLSRNERQCVFNGEEKLLYFRHYSSRSCVSECRTRFLYNQCKCLPYNLPSIYDKVTICNVTQTHCIHRAVNDWLLKSDGDEQSYCKHCLQSCFDLTYKSDATWTPLRAHDYLTPPSILRNMSMEYVNKNVAIVHFYYRETVFHGDIKNVYVGFTEFLSYTGGIMGLFMGFSFISVAEIIYFAFLRPIFEFILPLRRKRMIERKTAVMAGLRPHFLPNNSLLKVNRE